jgi:hypothetical protein
VVFFSARGNGCGCFNRRFFSFAACRGNREFEKFGVRENAALIVDLVVEREGLPKTRSATRKKMSAFERTADILRECGFEVKPETIIDWYSDWR